jgi:hypothetical protein
VASFSINGQQGVPRVFITILDGPLSTRILMEGQDPGTIMLEGRSLMYKGMPFETRQRLRTEFYAGNTVGTQQVLGPVLEPMTVNGMWKDKYLGNGQAMALALLFDEVARSGAPLEFEWDQIVRRGTMARFKFNPLRVEDIEWEATFEWASQGEKTAPLITATAVQNPREGLQAVVGQLQAVDDAVHALLDDPISRVVGFHEEVTDALDRATTAAVDIAQQIDRAVGVVTNLANIPREIVERGITVSRAAAQAARDVENGLLDPLFSLADPGSSGTWIGFRGLAYNVADDPLGLVTYLGQKLGLLGSTQSAREFCMNTAAGLEGQLYPEIIGEERPPAGTDLRDLARKYYGDADAWWIIAQFNGLPGSSVPALPSGPSDNPGRTIKIPRRPTGSLADLRQAC